MLWDQMEAPSFFRSGISRRSKNKLFLPITENIHLFSLLEQISEEMIQNKRNFSITIT
jgi:hypothetical protein